MTAKGIILFRRIKFVYGKIKKNGFSSTVTWVVVAVYERLIPQKQVIWYVDLTRLDPKNFKMPDDMKLERIQAEEKMDKEDLLRLTGTEGTELMGSAGKILLKERFKKGAVLWLLKVGGKLAGYQWTVSNDHVTPTYFPHTDNDAHTIGIEIFPEFRGKNFFNVFNDAVHYILKNEGFKRCYSETYLSNKASLKAYSKSNAKKIGFATRFNFFGRNVVIWTDKVNKKI